MTERLVNTAASADYYRQSRESVLGHLPQPLGRVLDVGCGAGATAPALRARGATMLEGVEIVPAQALRARELFDVVHIGAIEDVLPTLEGPFDTLLCLDVLEHLVDPRAVLEALRDLSSDDGHLQVSIPNARHKSLIFDLLVRGTFNYQDTGHRDWTHLRWFTRSDIDQALRAAGWRTIASGGSDPGPRGRLLTTIFGPTAFEFFSAQLHVTAAAVPVAAS